MTGDFGSVDFSGDTSQIVSAPVSRDISFYTGLVTPEHADKPDFMAMVAMLCQPFVDVQAFLASLPAAFDVDAAIGVQLDAVGVRVGLARGVQVPIAGIYFSFDDINRGFDRGVWQGPYDTSYAISLLDDDTYRRLLKTKIQANAWDGTIPTAQAILEQFVDDPTVLIFLQDNAQSAIPNEFFSFDDPARGFNAGSWYIPGEPVASVADVNASMTIAIAGNLPPLPLLFLLEQNAIPIKPSGVALDYAFTSIEGAPLFGFDIENEYVSGFDNGAWGVDATFVLNGETTTSSPEGTFGAGDFSGDVS